MKQNTVRVGLYVMIIIILFTTIDTNVKIYKIEESTIKIEQLETKIDSLHTIIQELK